MTAPTRSARTPTAAKRTVPHARQRRAAALPPPATPAAASATSAAVPARPTRNPLDLRFQAAVARATLSVSPISLLLALVDWSGRLAGSPGKRMELANLAQDNLRRISEYALALAVSRADCPAQQCVEPPARDKRFVDPAWNRWPFNLMHQSFLLTEAWWEAATTGVAGVSPHHEHVVSFTARQILDVFSPGNYLATNPLVIQRTIESAGLNLMRGLSNLIEDASRNLTGQPPVGAEAYVVGRDVAVTPGKVVLRTPLMELIQYTPTTASVRPEPILIVPAWIMKYYILDLSPHNSLVRYLVGQGYTVFCISWKNPGREEAGMGMDDYLRLGFFAALDAINSIVPGRKVHATGYCLGGTLLAIANAAMARDGDDRLASMNLFTAQTDFTEPGELALFIDEGEVSLLEAQMESTGYLTAGQMAGAFQLLRSYDLMWSRMVGEYLMGERPPMNDLMAWNADATRMPARMHSEYLRRLFLYDALSEGRYLVDDRPVSLSDIDTPTYCVATLTDHVAPWRSVHKIHYLTSVDLRFVLTSGGHNAGIVSEPGRPRRNYQALDRPADANYIAPDDWLRRAPQHDGSWWEDWAVWLGARSGKPVAPPPMGSSAYPPLADAPGEYVLEK